MKYFFKHLRRKTVKAFTLVEMLLVLAIVSVLLLLFVPNLSKQKESIDAAGGRALVKVVESQAELYELKHGQAASLEAMVQDKFISREQSNKYKEFLSKPEGREYVQIPD